MEKRNHQRGKSRNPPSLGNIDDSPLGGKDPEIRSLWAMMNQWWICRIR